MSISRIHSPSNPSCLSPCLWSPCLARSPNPYILSVHCTHVRGIETTHISSFDGMSANRIHSPSNPSCLAPCLWSPGLAHSLNPYSLSVHDACTLGSGTYGDGSCRSICCHIEYRLIHPNDRHLSLCWHSNNPLPTFLISCSHS